MADGITRIAVEGFKSISKKQSIDIAPLTILAGANSSGKSSIMQPLLMLKQTLEQTFDPGPQWIGGPNVNFTAADQFISKVVASGPRPSLTIELEFHHGHGFRTTFQKSKTGMEVVEQRTVRDDEGITLRPNMNAQEISKQLDLYLPDPGIRVVPNRFFLAVSSPAVPIANFMTEWVAPFLLNMIHVPGLRGNRSRTYPVAAVGSGFPGTFDNYAASVILSWQIQQTRNYEDLNCDVRDIGLADGVFAHRVDETAIELRAHSSKTTFSLADVGFGVSQTLPVLVALRAASEGQLVYLEEPEIHLHPRAQVKLGDVLAGAAKRGVRVVVETHSSLLLRAIQTLVAQGELAPELVRFHWFTRDDEGVTDVRSVTPDQNGAFGDWPEDFGDVALQSEKEYLDAVESKLAR